MGLCGSKEENADPEIIKIDGFPIGFKYMGSGFDYETIEESKGEEAAKTTKTCKFDES